MGKGQRRRRVPWLGLACAMGWLGVGLIIAHPGGPVRADGEADFKTIPGKTVGPEAVSELKEYGQQGCAECHGPEYEAWSASTHSAHFSGFRRSDEATAIAQKMGIDRISTRKESRCWNCHFTVQEQKRGPQAIAGVSCESCHGSALDWVLIHGDKEAAPKAERFAQADASGMIRPVALYQLAANCYECHTIPDPELIEVGGHPPLSEHDGRPFELVAWSQGEVRHNLLDSAGIENLAAGVERQRELYLVGQLVGLEYQLRALARATGEGAYATHKQEGVGQARKQVAALEAATEAAVKEQLGAALAAVPEGISREQAGAAADTVGGIARQLAGSIDGAKLGGIDGLLPDPSHWVGTPYAP